MSQNPPEPVQIDPAAYVETLQEEVGRLHADNLQLRAAVRHLQALLRDSQPTPLEGVPGQHPGGAEPVQ